MTYQLIRLTRPDRLRLEEFARLAGVHPELVQRFVVLGLLEATTDQDVRSTVAFQCLVGRTRATRRVNQVGYLGGFDQLPVEP